MVLLVRWRQVLQGRPFRPFQRQHGLRCPATCNINRVDGIDELILEGGAAMSDGIGFQKTGAMFIPLIGADGNMLFQERARLGGGETNFAPLRA